MSTLAEHPDRRERKLAKRKAQMKVDGRSVFLAQRMTKKRAERIKKIKADLA
jgi:hypothetical protein